MHLAFLLGVASSHMDPPQEAESHEVAAAWLERSHPGCPARGGRGQDGKSLQVAPRGTPSAGRPSEYCLTAVKPLAEVNLPPRGRPATPVGILHLPDRCLWCLQLYFLQAIYDSRTHPPYLL